MKKFLRWSLVLQNKKVSILMMAKIFMEKKDEDKDAVDGLTRIWLAKKIWYFIRQNPLYIDPDPTKLCKTFHCWWNQKINKKN